MIRNQADGRDLLGAMADAAAARAGAHLGSAIRMARCDRVQLNEGITAPEVEVETWPVSTGPQAIVISVFATAPRDDGGRVTAASGRFTFTTSTNQRDNHAGSAPVQPHGRDML
ncbi:MAG TPA: hypothetical protein VFF94_14485 [Novosphingobium sp.]|nr:hypothetical protein [Novosphingobium sp.]